MTDNEKRSTQKEQSRRWIAEALLQLMAEKPFAEITISEVATRADLSRRTFYRHFNDLDEVVDYLLNELCDEFIATFESTEHRKGDLEQATERFFRFWSTKRDVLRLLVSSNRASFPQRALTEMIYSKRLITLQAHAQKEMDYMYQFVMGGLWNMLIKWAADTEPPTIEEMKQIIHRVFTIATKEKGEEHRRM